MRKIKEFLSSVEEWHSFVIGWAEIICPWKPYIPRAATAKKISMTERTAQVGEDYIQEDWHYYSFGRAMGVFTWLIIIVLLVIFFS